MSRAFGVTPQEEKGCASQQPDDTTGGEVFLLHLKRPSDSHLNEKISEDTKSSQINVLQNLAFISKHPFFDIFLCKRSICMIALF